MDARRGVVGGMDRAKQNFRSGRYVIHPLFVLPWRTMRLSPKAAIVTAATALLFIPASASAEATVDMDEGRYQKGANWNISGNAGYDPTLPSLTGDVYIDRGAPLEGEVWYIGHGGEYGPDYDPSSHERSGEPAGPRALASEECGVFTLNFGTDPLQFAECVSAVASVVRADDVRPWEACRATSLSKVPADGER